MVWHVRQGVVDGTPLNNLNVVAVIASSANLGLEKGERRTALYVDDTATPAQKKALVALFTERYRETFGKVIAVKSARIAFAAEGVKYRAEMPDVLRLEVETFRDAFEPRVHRLFLYPGAEVVWYKPFAPLSQSSLAMCWMDQYQDDVLGVRWKRANPTPNGYAGTFELPVGEKPL